MHDDALVAINLPPTGIMWPAAAFVPGGRTQVLPRRCYPAPARNDIPLRRFEGGILRWIDGPIEN
jgi:hypothetical protein